MKKKKKKKHTMRLETQMHLGPHSINVGGCGGHWRWWCMHSSKKSAEVVGVGGDASRWCVGGVSGGVGWCWMYA